MEAIEEKISERKIKPNDAIIMMLDAVAKDDIGAFYQIANRYGDSVARGGEMYYRIKRAIQNRPMTMRRLDDLSHGLKNLLIQGQDISSGVTFLNEETKELIDGLLIEWKHKDLFVYHNIRVRHKILLHGPTGNGKTTVARHIASVAQIPFVEVKAEEVIDSHLGVTSGNIFKILNEIKEPCVLFWDEVDSIGGKRKSTSDSAAGHENDRMTNAILTNLDRITPNVIFVAATNRYEFLDSAFLRRFDVKHEMKAPNLCEKKQFVDAMIKYYKIEEGITEVPQVDNYSSFSDIKDVISGLARKYVLSKIAAQT